MLSSVTASVFDVLDQQQIDHTSSYCEPGHFCGFIISNSYCLAQSFIPTLPILTRVKLQIFPGGSPEFDLMISIRDEIISENIVTCTIPADEIPIPVEGVPLEFIEIEFPNIIVEPGQTYYIIAEASDVEDPESCYGWVFGENTTYTDGIAWMGHGYYPTAPMEEFDLCFETYGRSIAEVSYESL
jgi:hypothetical protein